MEKSEFRKNASDMIYLTICALKGKTPRPERIANLDLPMLFEVCQKHILTACVAYALESAGIKDKDFTQAKEKAVRKNIILDAECAKILHRLEEEKIWHMPLKGALLHHWYPKIGMRQMSDNDILFDKARRSRVKELMTEMGFTCEHYGIGNDDAYFKPPVCNFEMHNELFAVTHMGTLYEYYRNVKERLIPDDDSGYGYHFSNEDFYIFMMAHEYKHFSKGGTGVRSLVDTYVFLDVFEDLLDWDYISVELEKLGIADFERSNRELAIKVLDVRKLTHDYKKLLDYYVMSEIYGTIENSVNNRIESEGGGSKAAYVWHRIFPPMKFYKAWYPWAYKHKCLIPAAWVFRLIRGATVRRGRLTNEIKQLGYE